MHYPQLVHASQSPCGSTELNVFCLARVNQRDGEWLRVQSKASVVVMLHLCPVGDPVLFLWFLRLKSQIELITFSLANFHPLVLWHYPVVHSSLEESKLVGKEREKEEVTLKRIKLHSGRAGINDGVRRRFRLRKIQLGKR